jgi:hypothetical protein
MLRKGGVVVIQLVRHTWLLWLGSRLLQYKTCLFVY